MPPSKSMERTAQRQKKEESTDPKLPKKAADIILPENCKVMDDGTQFLHIDTGGNDRIMCFSTPENIETLKKCSKILRPVHVFIKPL